MKLYEISSALKDIESMIEEGAPVEQMADSLADMTEDFEQKAKDIIFVIANMSSDIAGLKAEEQRFKDRRILAEKQKARLEDYLRDNMWAASMSNIDNGTLKASIEKPRPVIEIVNEDLIPDSFRNIKTTVSIDKAALLKAAKEEEIAGARVGESKPSLKIK